MNHDEQRKSAIEKEIQNFDQFYRWLTESMPGPFFDDVPADWISLIVHSLVGFKVQDYFTEIHLKSSAIALCLDLPDADLKILEHYPLYGIKNYTTYVSSEPFPGITHHLRIAIMIFTEAFETSKQPLSEEVQSDLRLRHPEWSIEKIQGLISKMDATFLKKLPQERRLLAFEVMERAEKSDHCQYEVQYEQQWKEKDIPSMRVVLAWKNTPKHNFLYRLMRVVHRHNLVMRGVVAAYLDPYTTHSIFLLSFSLHGHEGKAAWEVADVEDFLQELVSLKYFGSFDLIDSTFVQTKRLRGNIGNFLRSTVNFVHQILVHVDPNLYTVENVMEGLCRHPELTALLAQAFEYKLHPKNHDLSKYEEARKEFIALVHQIDTGQEMNDIRRKNVLLQSMNFVSHILKTNFYRKNKTALSFRVDPDYLNYVPFDRAPIFPEIPYGIFFIKGMHFISYHIRFKDLARGGLRTVFPDRRERMLAEQNNVFLECYNLAYTQHKKNKDIPEGGAKAIIFLKPYERLASEAEILQKELTSAGLEKKQIDEQLVDFQNEQKLEYLYQTQRAFIQNFLTLINYDESGKLRAGDIIDYYGKPEDIYLGPDENMHNVMIEWIAAESKREKYRPGGAFISGKPTIGINHKEYGVTSLGVNVYMHQILLYLGINPMTDSFTVKMTGGPDGDVGGNQIHNLYRYYRNTAKLVALTDVSGTIFDPEGLDLEACNQLFLEGKSIRFYPPMKLHKDGFLLDRETRKEQTPFMHLTLIWRNVNGKLIQDWLPGNEMNALFRNNVHQTYADVFIPCGGRPRTLRETNFSDFLDTAGVPTSRAIVEGANLYLSQGAREELEKLGVIIVKDSSANKGGVICSSFEILSTLTLTEEQFLAYKSELVAEILERLKQCCFDEAHLLLQTLSETGRPLTEISEQISKRINYFTDQLLAQFENREISDPLMQCFLNYSLPLLKERFPSQLLSNIRDNHKKAIIACHIASRLVYRRGLDWFPSLIDILPLILEDPSLFA